MGTLIKDCAISNRGKLLHKFYCVVLGIVATVMSLINCLSGAVHIMSKTKAVSYYGKSINNMTNCLKNNTDIVGDFFLQELQYLRNKTAIIFIIVFAFFIRVYVETQNS